MSEPDAASAEFAVVTCDICLLSATQKKQPEINVCSHSQKEWEPKKTLECLKRNENRRREDANICGEDGREAVKTKKVHQEAREGR